MLWKKETMTLRILLSRLKNEALLLRIRMKSALIHACLRPRRCIYFISTPTHGNLGDQAIVLAQYRLMEKLGVGKNVIEITRRQYERNRERLRSIIRPQDLIIVDGGGSMGTLWPEEEHKMRDIVRRFPDNPLFIFPQTAYYSPDEAGEKELEQAVQVYASHPKLTVFCRDRETLRLFRTRFSKLRFYYTPDMVPYLCPKLPDNPRSGILFCLRSDLERVADASRLQALQASLREQGFAVLDASTTVPGRILRRDRQAALMRKWTEFAKARLVITDRLHGMIFCAITGTPCIALDNVSRKVRGGYEWLRPLPYIAFCESLGELEGLVAAALKQSASYHYDNSFLLKQYQIIEDAVAAALQL